MAPRGKRKRRHNNGVDNHERKRRNSHASDDDRLNSGINESIREAAQRQLQSSSEEERQGSNVDDYQDISLSDADALRLATTTSMTTAFAEQQPFLRLDAKLASMGLTRINVKGDGNCQFRSVLLGLGEPSDDGSIKQLRENVVAWLRNNRSYMNGRETLPTDVYLSQMKMMKEWGDDLTLLALANIFRCRIVAVCADGLDVETRPLENVQQCVTVYVAYRPELHYDAVRPCESVQDWHRVFGHTCE